MLISVARFAYLDESNRWPVTVGIRASVKTSRCKTLEELGKLAKIVSNTQRIDARRGITRSYSSPREDRPINALEASVNEL